MGINDNQLGRTYSTVRSQSKYQSVSHRTHVTDNLSVAVNINTPGTGSRHQEHVLESQNMQFITQVYLTN